MRGTVGRSTDRGPADDDVPRGVLVRPISGIRGGPPAPPTPPSHPEERWSPAMPAAPSNPGRAWTPDAPTPAPLRCARASLERRPVGLDRLVCLPGLLQREREVRPTFRAESSARPTRASPRSNLLNRHAIGFEAASPTAHAFAYLRINAPVAGDAARLATGPGGLTPDRAGFAPSGRRSGVPELIASFISPWPAGPGRNWTDYPLAFQACTTSGSSPRPSA